MPKKSRSSKKELKIYACDSCGFEGKAMGECCGKPMKKTAKRK